MDYKQKYENALERCKKEFNFNNLAYSHEEIKQRLERVFPELKESEDDMIRNFISHELACLRAIDEKGSDRYEELTNAIAWLEKQGEEKLLNNDKYQTVSVKILDRLYESEKELERLKQGEQKPNDEIEPKFKVGDWVVLDRPVLITKVEDMPYNTHQYWTSDGTWFGDATKAKLWTIQNAKDGDVLCCENGWTCIFKSLNSDSFSSYCFMDCSKWFCELGGECHSLNEKICGKIHPATKEQRDKLEKSMVDAGYTFDFEKKELKKIEQKPTWSEEDEKIFNSIIEDVIPIGECPDYPTYEEREYYYEGDRKVNWLKSLKERMKG